MDYFSSKSEQKSHGLDRDVLNSIVLPSSKAGSRSKRLNSMEKDGLETAKIVCLVPSRRL